MEKMRACVFHGKDKIRVEEIERPRAGFGEAVIRVTLTTICGTDLHIVRGEYPVKPGLIIGHEPVGVVEELGPGITGCNVGDRVLVGAITPCGQCHAVCRGNFRSADTARVMRLSAAGVSATRSTARGSASRGCTARAENVSSAVWGLRTYASGRTSPAGQ